VTPTLVLVHGAGDTARVWRATQELLDTPSFALDLLGRGSRPFDLTAVTIELAARHAARDVEEHASGDVVVVAHSAGGIVAPRLAAVLGDRVRHLVLVAGVTAPEGEVAADVVHPERRAQFEAARPKLLGEHRGRSYARGESIAAVPSHLEAIADPGVVRAIESLNLMFQPVSWKGVRADLPRTFVRPLGDPLQTREMQARLAAAARCTEVVDIDADHTPARSAPAELAALLDVIAARYRSAR